MKCARQPQRDPLVPCETMGSRFRHITGSVASIFASSHAGDATFMLIIQLD